MKSKMFAVAGLAALLLTAPWCNGQSITQANAQPPRDLWRIVDGVTNCICGPGFNDWYFGKESQWVQHGGKQTLAAGWVMVAGTVIEVQPLGIRVRGYTNFEGTESALRRHRQSEYVYQRDVPGYESQEKVFFIADYPYPVAENDEIAMCVVKQAGIYTYNTVSGGSASIHKFDYGLVASRPVAPAPPPMTAEELQAAQAATALKKAELQANAAKFDKEMADKGDSYSQRRMGERYRDGDGVKKSLDAARIWLTFAATQGDKEAAKELNELPSK